MPGGGGMAAQSLQIEDLVPKTGQPILELKAVSKAFGMGARVVNDVSLSVFPGEFLSLLGPSGCGKTTILRMLAGFENPSAGKIFVDGADFTDVPAYRRGMSMVFQNYALFPHRTVSENVAFGLRMRKVDRDAIKRKVEDALSMVALSGLGDRKPSQLSGGQQQRVALARALVVEPKVLLCDEPLAALDKKLRQAMQVELKQLQRRIGVTLIFVTHDQEEALAMSDRVAVINAGRIEQIAAPAEIYNTPQTSFAADFIGDTNLFRGTVESRHDKSWLVIDGSLSVELPTFNGSTNPVAAALRPERVILCSGTVKSSIKGFGRIESVLFQGQGVLFYVEMDGGQKLMVREGNSGGPPRFQPGQHVSVHWNVEDINLLWQ